VEVQWDAEERWGLAEAAGNVRVCRTEVELSSDHRREEHNIRKGDGHATAGEWMTHVPRIAEEDNTFLGVWPTSAFGNAWRSCTMVGQDDAHDEGEREQESRWAALGSTQSLWWPVLGSMGPMGVCRLCCCAW